MRKLLRAGLIVVPILAIGAGSIAWAAWSIRGAGSSQAQAETAVPIAVVSATTAPSTLLYPGGSADMVIRVRNGNHFPVTITRVTRTSKPITTDAGHAACPGSLLDTTRDDDTFAVNVHLLVNEEKEFTVPRAIWMSPEAGNACQGAQFGIPVSLFGTSG
ncbi:hypothetical protein [Dactylosporangium sp. NPDC051541]|uniref:hypothetical protein n=1 Tax=Dactylosporangium sp. NPDC051541 TaxID=3363977 RepID=UPI0037B1B1E7